MCQQCPFSDFSRIDPRALEFAATKIQAGWKGYQVRKNRGGPVYWSSFRNHKMPNTSRSSLLTIHHAYTIETKLPFFYYLHLLSISKRSRKLHLNVTLLQQRNTNLESSSFYEYYVCSSYLRSLNFHIITVSIISRGFFLIFQRTLTCHELSSDFFEMFNDLLFGYSLPFGDHWKPLDQPHAVHLVSAFLTSLGN